jgi:hypothetical protein
VTHRRLAILPFPDGSAGRTAVPLTRVEPATTSEYAGIVWLVALPAVVAVMDVARVPVDQRAQRGGDRADLGLRLRRTGTPVMGIVVRAPIR